MNAPLAAHSVFGGSVARRILACPGCVREIEKVPAYLRKESAFAARGTALHAATSFAIEAERSADECIGTIFDHEITREDAENALRPVLSYVNALLDQGAEFFLERRVQFPGIPEAFGTADLIARLGNVAHVVDYKYGVGIRVLALYPDGDEDVVNSQLLFYAAAARHSIPTLFAGVEHIELTILQPVSIEPEAEMVSSVTVTNAELDQFIAAYKDACEEALSPSPRLARGDHCRFCAARPICPEHTKPLLTLAQFELLTRPAAASKAAYLQLLADGLNLVDAVKDIGKALHDQAKAALDAGNVVPGYALTKGRAERHWRDEESVAIAALEELGLTRDDIIAETVRSPKQVEVRARARGLTIPPEFISSRRSGTSLVRAENARDPVCGRVELAQSFAAALEALTKGGGT